MITRQTDVAVIGTGTAGLSAYRAARQAGKQALLIEDGPYGTTCARVGCMPSKLLIAAAEAAHVAQHGAPFGVHVDGTVRIDGREVMARVRSERDRFVGFVLESVEGIPAADKLRGRARFLSDTVLDVDGHTRVEARSVVIATGSRPVVPEAYAGLGERLLVNDDVFEWQDLPRSVAVYGPGVIGLELGQALARLGVTVRLFGRSGSLGGITDPEVAASALAAFQQEFYLDAKATVHSVVRQGDQVEIRYVALDGSECTERFDYVLMATGRRPNVDDIGLEHTSAALDERGVPLHDKETLQVQLAATDGTQGLPIFIAGDATAELPLLHEAADEGRIAGRNAANWPDVEAGQRRAGLSIVFSEPQIAKVGPGYRALSKQQDIVAGEVDFSNQGRSRVMLRNKGKLRVYAAPDSGRFLGAEMAGPSAEHIGHLLAWALQQQMTIPQMLEMPFYHPVVEEGLRTALRDVAGKLKMA